MEADSSPKPRPKRRSSLYQWSAKAFRWVHIYISMLSFGTMMFFAFTGITLNHPTWFGASEQAVHDSEGQLTIAIAEGEVDKLAVAEDLRHTNGLRGKVAEFEVDDAECMVVFKNPGYAADVFVDRETGKYTVTESVSGWMAVLNDLHKGRDSGEAWSWVIDVSAIVLVLVALSGFGLLMYLRKRRAPGTWTAFAGTVVLIVVWAIWVR